MKEDEVSRVEPSVVAQRRLDLPRKPHRDSSQRTPGPWRVFTERFVEDGCLLIDVVDSSITTICEVNQSGDADLERHLANANLLAAAPELLAALQDITFRFATVCAATGEFSEANAKALDAASVAMQKALGEA